MKTHPHLLVRDALAEVFVRSCGGDPEADERIEALVRWAKDGTVGPTLRTIRASEEEPLFTSEGLHPRLEALLPYVRDRAPRFAAARAWIREEHAESDPVECARAAWDAALFFEVHEILEPVWMETKEPERTPLQGLIMAAAALHHLEGGNRAGAISLAREGARRVRQAPAGFRVEIEPLARALEAVASDVEAGHVRTLNDLADAPPFRMRSDTLDGS